jgi:hypothetical protein
MRVLAVEVVRVAKVGRIDRFQNGQAQAHG